MKIPSLLLAATFALVVAAPALAQQTLPSQTFSGNGATGFGGQIGNSTLTVTVTNNAGNTDGTIAFSLQTTGFTNNGLAIYLDTQAGGFNSTSAFTDTRDNGRALLSGLSSNGRTLATFAPGFTADYGIAVEPGTFAGVFNLTPNADGSFPFVTSAGLDNAATTTLNFSVLESQIGLTPGQSFNFVASLLSGGEYRSNETFGTSTTVPANSNTAPNAGFTGSTTFSDSFVVATPEPSLGVCIGLGLVVAGGLLRRTRRVATV